MNDDMIRKLNAEGMSWAQIGRVIGADRRAVRHRGEKLGLTCAIAPTSQAYECSDDERQWRRKAERASQAYVEALLRLAA